MDELTGTDRAPVLRFGPDRRVSALLAGGAILALVLALTAVDGAGRLLFAMVVMVLAGYSIGDLAFWPRLLADASGLRIRTPLARANLTWSDVDDVRADERTRYGLRSTTLEVDAGQTLVVFSRRELGADTATVQDLVRALAPRRDQ